MWGVERAVREQAPRRHLGRSLSAAPRALSLSGRSGALPQPSAVNGGGMEREGSGGSGASAGLLQQILSLKLVPRVGNGTLCPNSTSLCSFPGTAALRPRSGADFLVGGGRLSVGRELRAAALPPPPAAWPRAPRAGHPDPVVGPVGEGNSASPRTRPALWSSQTPRLQAGTRQRPGGGRPSSSGAPEAVIDSFWLGGALGDLSPFRPPRPLGFLASDGASSRPV